MSQLAIIQWDQAYNRNGDPKLPRAVVNVIRTYMDNATLTGWVKQDTLAEATGLQVRGVRKQIAANVAAGWLEVIQVGNSSGLASTYRLTYPKEVPQDLLETSTSTKAVPQDRIPESPPKAVPQDRIGSGEAGPRGPEKAVLQDLPTTPITSPQEKLINRTSPEKEVLQDLIADPWGSGIRTPTETTTKSKEVLQDRLDPWGPPKAVLQDRIDDPWTLHSVDPEARLLGALAGGPIPAKRAEDFTTLKGDENVSLVKRLIAMGTIVHNTDEQTLSLSQV